MGKCQRLGTTLKQCSYEEIKQSELTATGQYVNFEYATNF